MKQILLIMTTVPDADVGESIVSELLALKLIACGHVAAAGTSIFIWEGEMKCEEECAVLAKTSVARGAELAEKLNELHPYDVPEILLIHADASDAYAQWVERAVEGPPD